MGHPIGYSNNDGRFIVGTGERAFTLQFFTGGHGVIYISNDTADINTVALAPGVRTHDEIGDATAYDGSSRVRTIRVGDAAILRNRKNYWAAVFVDEVLTRESSPIGEPRITFRYFIPPVPSPVFGATES